MSGFFDEHLGLDAVVAFADGELSLVAYQRAAAHLARCESCAAEVAEQSVPRQRLRAAPGPVMPAGLFDTLRSIPVALPAQPPVTGVVADPATGRVSGPEHRGHGGSHRGRGFRIGAGAIVAGLAVGALAAVVAGEHGHDPAGGFNDTAKVYFGQPGGPGVLTQTRAGR